MSESNQSHAESALQVQLEELQDDLESAGACLLMIRERILIWGKKVVGPEYSLDSTPDMFLGEAMHNLLVRVTLPPKTINKN